MNQIHRGYIDLTIAQVCIAINTVAAKYLLDVMPIYFYLGVRFFSTTIVLALMAKLSHAPLVSPDHPEGKLSRRDWSLLWGQALTAGVLFNVLLMLGMRYTTATSAGIVSSSLPAILALMSYWLLGEKLSAYKIVGILLAVVGVGVLSLDSVGHASGAAKGSLIGDFLVFLAMIPEALYSIFSKLLNRRVEPMMGGMCVSVFSTILLMPFFLYATWDMSFSAVPLLAWLLLPVTVISSTGFYWLWGRGLKHVPASTGALFGGVMPVATSIIAVIFLSEIFTRYDALGMFFVLLSIIVGTGMKIKRYSRG